MKSTILNQSDVQDFYRRNFLMYPIDMLGDTTMTDFNGKETLEKVFALEHRARATPTIIFFDLEGKPVARFTGATKDKDEFLLLGRYVLEGAYKQMPFARYKLNQNNAK
jgi:thioredoxin-related protein